MMSETQSIIVIHFLLRVLHPDAPMDLYVVVGEYLQKRHVEPQPHLASEAEMFSAASFSNVLSTASDCFEDAAFVLRRPKNTPIRTDRSCFPMDRARLPDIRAQNRIG